MKPEEKANQLIAIYENLGYTINGAQCALVVVMEMLDFMEQDDKESETCYWANHPKLTYYYAVKKELLNKI
jgi:hypothetical protein